MEEREIRDNLNEFNAMLSAEPEDIVKAQTYQVRSDSVREFDRGEDHYVAVPYKDDQYVILTGDEAQRQGDETRFTLNMSSGYVLGTFKDNNLQPDVDMGNPITGRHLDSQMGISAVSKTYEVSNDFVREYDRFGNHFVAVPYKDDQYFVLINDEAQKQGNGISFTLDMSEGYAVGTLKGRNFQADRNLGFSIKGHDLDSQIVAQAEPSRNGQERPEQPANSPAAATDEQRHEENDRREQEAESRRHKQEERDAQERADRERREADGRRSSRSSRGRRGEQQKGLFARLRDLVSRVYQRVKHMAERAIGRGRILAQPVISRLNFQRSAMDQSEKNGPSVDKDKATQSKTNDKEQGRNWGDLLYHGFARRILGKDAYMHAVTQGDRQTIPEQDKPDQGKGQPKPEQPGNPSKGDDDAAQRPGEGSRPGNADNEKPQPAQEEMKGKFNSLHKIITNDLEDKYTNAKEAKEAYLAQYTQQLQAKLTEINGGQPVQVSASRENGQLTLHINDQKDQFGNYPSFMHASMIKIEIDSHLNVVSAEGKVFTGRTSNGNFIGDKLDLADTLGKYVVSDLARNFREDYNRGADSYNITSRNEFDKTMRDAAARNTGSFTIDNVTYMISVKDNQIQVGQTIGDKTFNIALDAGPDASEQVKQNYEAKVAALREAQQKLDDAEKSLNSAVTAQDQKQKDYDKANSKAMAATQAKSDIENTLRKIQRQLSGEYPSDEKMKELQEREQELKKERGEAYKQTQIAGREKNDAQLALNRATTAVRQASDDRDQLKNTVAQLQNACTEAKTQLDAASQARNGEIKELYQTHVQSVTADRESITHAFEEVLPGYHNSLGGRLGLEDLDKTMEDTGRTYMEEALDGQTLDGHENEEPSIGQEPDRDERQNNDRETSEERE